MKVAPTWTTTNSTITETIVKTERIIVRLIMKQSWSWWCLIWKNFKVSLLLSKKLHPPNTPKNQQSSKSGVVSRVSKSSATPSLSPVDSSVWGDKPAGSPATTDPSPYLTCLMSNPTQTQTPTSSTSLSSKSSSLHNSNSSITAGNGTNLTSLWVGNVDSEVTEEVLIEMFSAYGQLTNVRCLPDKYCAFINFKTKEEASKAMNALQVRLF